MDITDIKVQKRDKTFEPFDPQKIIFVVKGCGLTEEDAIKLANMVTGWLEDSHVTEVTTLQIRDRILVEIQKMDKLAAKKYIWYEKYKDKNY